METKKLSTGISNLYSRKILHHILIWTIAFTVFAFFRAQGEDLNSTPVVHLTLPERILFQLLLGTIAGILFGSYAYALERIIGRRFSFGATVVIGSLGYIMVILLLILMVFTMFRYLFEVSASIEELRNFFAEGNHRVLVAYCFIVGFLIEFVRQIDLKFGPGNLWRMLKRLFGKSVRRRA